ncbi:hypothetical protein Bca101_101845 [Brassica carinata]
MMHLGEPCGLTGCISSSKGSIGHAFTVRIRTENQNQTSFYPFVPHEISVLVELILGHLRYLLTDVPPQPNSPPDNVLRPDRPRRVLDLKEGVVTPLPVHGSFSWTVLRSDQIIPVRTHTVKSASTFGSSFHGLDVRVKSGHSTAQLDYLIIFPSAHTVSP